jgi:hypothetical protein
MVTFIKQQRETCGVESICSVLPIVGWRLSSSLAPTLSSRLWNRRLMSAAARTSGDLVHHSDRCSQ